jgi:hypothetical protein
LQLLATGVVSHRDESIKIREGTALSVRSLVNPGHMTCGLAAIQTNKQKIVGVQSRNKCSLGNVERKEWAGLFVYYDPRQKIEFFFKQFFFSKNSKIKNLLSNVDLANRSCNDKKIFIIVFSEFI